MTAQLGGTTLQAFWASIAFMLAVSVVQPIYVTTSDVLGRRIPLFVALALFFVGAIVFAVADNMATVIAGRVPTLGRITCFSNGYWKHSRAYHRCSF
jgi:MFS family permease